MSSPSIEPEIMKPEILISHLSYRPSKLINALIKITPPKPSHSTLADHASSLGILNRLPLELISIMLGMLDVQSIARFAMVSFRGNTFVQHIAHIETWLGSLLRRFWR